MSNTRKTDADKWHDPWFRRLSPGNKLVFLYLIDSCDKAGFYVVDVQAMAFAIGIKEESAEGALKELERAFLMHKKPDGERILWLKNFLKHQHDIPLNPSNNYHKHLIKLIESKIDIFPEISTILGASLGVFRGSEGASLGVVWSYKEKEKEKEKEKDKDIINNISDTSTYVPEPDKSSFAFVPPTMEQLEGYGTIIGVSGDECRAFFDYYQAKGWTMGGDAMKDWQAALRSWKTKQYKFRGDGGNRKPKREDTQPRPL